MMESEKINSLVSKYNTLRFVLSLIPNRKVFARFVRGYIRVNLLKKNQLRFVEIFVTLACNARCPFCSNGLFTKKAGNIKLEKYLDIIDQCADLDVPVVGFVGGEPLLYRDIDKLIERANMRGVLSQLITNGVLLTEERVKKLSEIGLNFIIISIHSMDSQKHDETLKIKGAYENIFKAKEWCKKYGVSFSLAGVVSHKDFVDGTFDKLVEYAEREKIYLKINPIIPTGFAAERKDDLLTSDDYDKFNRICKRSRYISSHLTSNYFGFGCPAGNAYLGINATGEIFPCFFFPVSLGDIHSVSMREAWEKAMKSPLFSKRHKMCYCGVSREFIRNYLTPVFGFKNIPIPIEEHPLYDKEIILPDLENSDAKDAIEFGEKRNPG